jgi:hypothetical protein
MLSLELALLRGGGTPAAEAAASLRNALRTDPKAWQEARAALLDPSTPTGVRQALALIFGTFDGAANDTALLEALHRFPEDTEFVRCALLGLGGAREPEDDDEVFGLGDRPWGAKGPGGLGITVRREIADAGTRAALGEFLARPEPALRAAAAQALRHSTASDDVRDSFLLALGTERFDDVAWVLGESLAVRAGSTADAADRARIVNTLLGRAGDEALDAYRFRMEDDFERVSLDPAARSSLRTLAEPSHPFAVRSFALSAAARSAAASGAEAVAEARALLLSLLRADRDAAVRDLAARLLARLTWDAPTGEGLAAAAKSDAAWNVRFTALEALASFGKRTGVAEALEAARKDSDERVAARAAELLRTLEGK